MIDVSLKFLVDEANAYLQRRLDSDFGKIELGPLVDDKGSWVATQNTLRLTLFQIEEERHAHTQIPQQVLVNGYNVALPPPLAIILVILFSASFTTYSEGLRLLSLLLTFFQRQHPQDPEFQLLRARALVMLDEYEAAGQAIDALRRTSWRQPSWSSPAICCCNSACTRTPLPASTRCRVPGRRPPMRNSDWRRCMNAATGWCPRRLSLCSFALDARS